MLQSSVRHAARTRPCPHTAPSRPSPTTQITVSFSSRSHQRRHSSSKPPVPPNDGARNIPTSSVKTVGTPRSKQPVGEQSATADGRIPKRKVARQKADVREDGDNEWTKNLPSVPSTQHVDPKDMALSAFFALHRPMSVHAFLPQPSSTEAVNSIFAPTKRSSGKPGSSEVMYTLASALQSLEGNINQQQQNPQDNTQQQTPERTDITVALTQHHNQQSNPTDQNQPQHLDGQPSQTNMRVPSGVQLMIQEVARRFRPYNTPPAPVPMSDVEIDAREAESAAAEMAEEMQAEALEKQIEAQDQEKKPSDTPQVVLTLQQDGDLQSRKFFTHQAPKIRIEDPENIQSVQRRLEEFEKAQNAEDAPSLYRRQRNYPAQRERQWRRQKIYAISVKRQRRLKMKKHKYKKLMKKTRNLRRRMDKL